MLWPFSMWRRKLQQADAYEKAEMTQAEMQKRYNLERKLLEEGWRRPLDFGGSLDVPDGIVLWTRDGETIFSASFDQFNPKYNDDGLWWRPLRDPIDVTPAGKV